jgi:hypothetical protein
MVMLACVLMMLGCARTVTYDVTVKNDLQQPVMIWLTKTGEPIERPWLSPEQIAIGTRPGSERLAGAVLQPGKTAHSTQKAQLSGDAAAVLRVYLGQHKLSELLAISRGSSDRFDVNLEPGHNSFIVHQHDGRVAVDPAGQ